MIPPNNAWVSAAAELGLSSHLRFVGGPSMHGYIGDIGVSVEYITRATRRVLRYQVAHQPSGPPVRIRRESPMRDIERRRGLAVDVQIGDPLFDDNLMVESEHPDMLREFLTPARRAALTHLFEQNEDCQVLHNTIAVFQKGIEFHAPNIIAMVTWLVDVASIMQDPDFINTALARQDAGDLAAATSDLHHLNQRQHNAFMLALQAEDHVSLGDREQAAALYDKMQAALPPASSGWNTLAHTPAPTTTTPAPAPPVTKQLDQQEVIDDLFDGSLAGYHAIERFDQHYANQPVHWIGEIERFTPYGHDGDFGAGPGIKAIVLLGGSGRSKLISNEVRAVVQLPPGLALRVGHTVSFTGTLFRIDRFSRNLYLTNASITH